MVSPFLLKSYYPVKYKDIVDKQAEKNNLDPYLVIALIKIESNFEPRAKSKKGAIGLMQVLPETADWINQRNENNKFGSDLFDPSTNISYGCWYFNFLMDRYQNKEMAIAAYNAGQSKVDSWFKENKSDESIIEKLPYPETREFVQKVLKTKEKYEKLYPGEFD